MSAEAQSRVTIEQYLALERQAETKSEYLNGEMFAMTGASWNHNLIVANTVASLHNSLRGKSCHVCANDMRVRVQATGLFTYPDVVVVCGEPELDATGLDTLLNPKLIVEVLSESAEGYDRGMKFVHYRTLPSLSEYVLIAQDKTHVERFARQEDGQWLFSETSDPASAIELPSVGCRLVLAEIYEAVFG